MSLLDKVPGELKLYIGGIYTLRRKQQLQEANITHVLSVHRLPVDQTLVSPYKHLLVEVDDVEDENLLQYFTTTNAFIQEGLDDGGGVLVHCAMGKSRSATCVIAFLMSKYHISPQEALAQIKQSRPLVEPNDGFMQQLEMYHKMQTPINVEESPIYQRWMYQREVQLSSECGMAPDADKIRFEDEHTAPGEEGNLADAEFKCKKCRRPLAKSQFLIPHPQLPHNNPFPETLTCAHLFLDPLSWMRPELEQGKVEGRLECPKCKSNVGKYAWQGMRCSCGSWVIPAITLAKGKVDEVRSRTPGEGGVRKVPGLGMPATSAQGRGLL